MPILDSNSEAVSEENRIPETDTASAAPDLPAPEPLSDSEVASAIADAVAAVFDGEDIPEPELTELPDAEWIPLPEEAPAEPVLPAPEPAPAPISTQVLTEEELPFLPPSDHTEEFASDSPAQEDDAL